MADGQQPLAVTSSTPTVQAAKTPGWVTRVEQANPEDHPVFGPLLKAVQGAVETYRQQPATHAAELGEKYDPNVDYTYESKPDWMHEAANPDHWWNQPFAHFREGIDRMTEDLHDYAETHREALTPAAYGMLHGVATLASAVPVGRSAPETLAMAAAPPDLPEGVDRGQFSRVFEPAEPNDIYGANHFVYRNGKATGGLAAVHEDMLPKEYEGTGPMGSEQFMDEHGVARTVQIGNMLTVQAKHPLSDAQIQEIAKVAKEHDLGIYYDLPSGSGQAATTGDFIRAAKKTGEPTPSALRGAADTQGVQYRGRQEGVPEKGIAGLHIFQDPQSGTSVGVKENEWSPEKLQEYVAAARERMAPKTTNSIAKPTSQQTVTAGGAGALSSEELARPETFIKFSKSGQPTHLGKEPDATLKPGEAILAINSKTGKVRVQNTEGMTDQEALTRFGSKIPKEK